VRRINGVLASCNSPAAWRQRDKWKRLVLAWLMILVDGGVRQLQKPGPRYSCKRWWTRCCAKIGPVHTWPVCGIASKPEEPRFFGFCNRCAAPGESPRIQTPRRCTRCYAKDANEVHQADRPCAGRVAVRRFASTMSASVGSAFALTQPKASCRSDYVLHGHLDALECMSNVCTNGRALPAISQPW
jgi:hypothetical protein